MDGNGRALGWFGTDDIKLEIPFFQRPYVWDMEEWNALFEGIKETDEENMPFIGSFILQETGEKKKYLVIDGQQRITTLSVLIKAFLDGFSEIPDDARPELKNMIYSRKPGSKMKSVFVNRLTPSQVDKDDYNLVMEQENKGTDIGGKGKIAEAYKYFYNKFKQMSEEENLSFGSKLLTSNKFFISITLEDNDDEQKIFDSVNSLGKKLTNSDIIKNYLFQKIKELGSFDGATEDQVLQLHDKYWMNIFYGNQREFWEKDRTFGRTKTSSIEAFLKDYATIKGIYNPYDTVGIDGLAKSYKNHINKYKDYKGVVAFAKDLAEYADCYFDYNNNYLNVDSLRITDLVNSTLLILDKTDTSTFNPYILKLLKNKPDDLSEQLFALQSFLVQRIVYGASTKNYNKVCEQLMKAGDPIQYLKKYNENEPMGIGEFPSGLKKLTKNALPTLILFIVEMIRRNGKEALYTDDLKYNKSLEHIIPQKWEKWINVPCYVKKDNEYVQITDINDVHEARKEAIYSIGNMTLLSGPLNSKVSNDVIKTKIEGNGKKDGIRKYVGSLTVAQDVIDTYDKTGEWTEREVAERNSKIFDELNRYYGFTK